MLRDLRLALRALRRQPGFAVLAVVILALGLGATTTTFSLVNAAVLRPLPFPDADRLVWLTEEIGNVGGYSVCSSQFGRYRAHNDVLEGMAAFEMRHVGLAVPDETTTAVWSLAVSADFFPILGVKPQLGRWLLAEEDQPGRDRVVVLSHHLWQRLLGGDPKVVGRALRIGDETVTVVGVMPAAFYDPLRRWTRVDLWRPLALPARAFSLQGSRGLEVVARLKPGITSKQAEKAMTALAARLDLTVSRSIDVKTLMKARSGLHGNGADAVSMTLKLAVLVLLVACTNLAGIQLARLAGRAQERAMRVALGASRGRLVREALLESLILGVAGGGLGLLLAAWCAAPIAGRLIVGGSSQITVGLPVTIDGRVLAFAGALVALSVVIVGTAPVWLASRGPLFDSLRTGRASTARGQGWVRQILVASEMALAVVLLASGALLLTGLEKFATSYPGWQADGLINAQLDLQGARHANPAGRAATFERLQQRLVALPGVQVAALSGGVPVTSHGPLMRFWIEGTPRPAPAAAHRAFSNWVSPEYFSALGIPLRQGRTFQAGDSPPGAERVVVISENMARRLWPGQNPLGRRLSPVWAEDPSAPPEWDTIVGVVGDIEYRDGLDESAYDMQIYHPRRAARSSAVVSLRVAGNEQAFIPAMLRAVAEVDPNVVVRDAMPARDMIELQLVNHVLIGWVMFALAAIGLVLAGLGVYGLFSGFVVDRTREIGVRMALGAQTGEVLSLVMRRGLRLALVGAALGLLGALVLVPELRDIAPGLPAPAVSTLVALPVALVAVAMFACWLPARRAAGVSPMTALRHE